MNKKSTINKAIIIGIIIVLIIGIVIGIALISSNSKKPQNLLDLGNRYLNEHNYEEAIAAFEEAIGIDDKLIEAYARLIEAYHAIGDDAKAIEYAYVFENILYELESTERVKYIQYVDSTKNIIEDIEEQNPDIVTDDIFDDISGIIGDFDTDTDDDSDNNDNGKDKDNEAIEETDKNSNLVLTDIDISAGDLDALLASMKAQDYANALSLLESGKYNNASKRNGGIYYSEGAAGALSGIKDGSGIWVTMTTKETVLANSPDIDPSWDIPNQYRVIYTTWENGKKSGSIRAIEFIDIPDSGLFYITESTVSDSQVSGAFYYENWQKIPEWGSGWQHMYISEGTISGGCASGAAKVNALYWPFGFMNVILEDGLIVGGDDFIPGENTLHGNRDILISPVAPKSGSISAIASESANVYE